MKSLSALCNEERMHRAEVCTSLNQKLGKHVMQYFIANHWLLLKQLQFVYVQCLTNNLISLTHVYNGSELLQLQPFVCIKMYRLCLSGFGIARLIDWFASMVQTSPINWWVALSVSPIVLLSYSSMKSPLCHISPSTKIGKGGDFQESLCLHRASEVLYHPSHHHLQ